MAALSNSRRQSTRASRGSRPSNYYAKPFSYRSSLSGQQMAGAPGAEDAEPPGFFPAIQYFTDATAALPKEVQKHLTLLKETEGKAYAPAQNLTALLDAIDQIPGPPQTAAHLPPPGFLGFSTNNSAMGSANGSVIDGMQPPTTATASVHGLATPTHSQATFTSTAMQDPHATERENLHRHLQETLGEMVMILDEKNMVLANANETLLRQLARLDEVMPHIDNEISEETRLGSNTHWALPHMKEIRRAQNGVTNERSRRDVEAAAKLAAAAAAVHEGDIVATRSEARREAMLAKRNRNAVAESDFDERGPVPTKKGSKNKREKESAADSKGASNAKDVAAPSSKKRRVDKTAAAASSVPMERSISAALNGRLGSGGAREESRDRAADPPVRSHKKKTVASQAANNASASNRKKPTANSPSITAASPIRATFPHNKEASPAPTMQRAPSNRGRQNSVQSNATKEAARARPSSAASSKRSGNGASATSNVTGNAGSNVLSNLTSAVAPPDKKSNSVNMYSRFAGDSGAPPNDDADASEREMEIAAAKAAASIGKGSSSSVANAQSTTVPAPSPLTGLGISTPSAAPASTNTFKREDTEPAPDPQSVTAEPKKRSKPPTPVAEPTPADDPPSKDEPTPAPVPAEATTSHTVTHSAPVAPRSRTSRSSASNPSSSRGGGSREGSPRAASPKRPVRKAAATRKSSAAALAVEEENTGVGGGTVTGKAPAKVRAKNNGHSKEAGPQGNNNNNEEEEDEDNDEPRYCICGGVSYGDMIACDNSECPHEWFHLDCVGLARAPTSREWYCSECRPLFKTGVR